MANYFWEQTERLLLNALIAVFMAHKFKKHFFKRFDETKVESYLRIERTFENHAIELINRAQQHDPCRTSELMESESDPYWPKLSLMEIAAAGNAKEFLGTEACQSEIFRRWNRGYECNRKKYLAAFMFPPLIFFDFFVRFDEENAAAKWHSKDPTVYRKMDRCPQLQSSLQSNNQCRLSHFLRPSQIVLQY
ncbi:unnamed protein product [Anisakis simplex]|uniref:TRPM-like domain-containing protein n=1 Tax=Anisakis simplex TaxID=6269 RepID=A0A0M3K186_ANISI|nr:unnamed protein product [Anisakis simplex]